jgi:hypothetical protein
MASRVVSTTFRIIKINCNRNLLVLSMQLTRVTCDKLTKTCATVTDNHASNIKIACQIAEEWKHRYHGRNRDH